MISPLDSSRTNVERTDASPSSTISPAKNNPSLVNEEGSSEDISYYGKPTISCICLFQNIESVMLKCVICATYSHSECYDNVDLLCSHICVKCASSTGRPCTSDTVLEKYNKSKNSKPDRKRWVFALMQKRVLHSILREEYKLVQPGLAPDEPFLRLRFQLSESYATRVLFNLVKEGAIKLYGGFEYDVPRIQQLLGLPSVHPSIPKTVNTVIPTLSMPATPVFAPATPTLPTPFRSILKPRTQISNTSADSNSDTTTSDPGPSDHSKKISWSDLHSPSPSLPHAIPLVNPFVDDSEDSTSSVRVCDSPQPVPSYASSPHKRRSFSPQMPIIPEKRSLNSFSSDNTRTTSVPSQKQFQNHYVWPDRYVSRESRRDDEEIEPASIADFGKKSKRPVFGQIIETRAPKENSNNPNTWNFHFIVGKGGVLVQAWVFGPKDEVLSFAERIRVDEYFVFWGYTVKENKYSTNLSSNLEWGIYIPSNSTKFERVIVTKVFQKSDDNSNEEQEIFSNSFRQAGRPHKVPKKQRKKEHSFKEKEKLIDKSQRKITEYADDVSPPLLLNVSNESLLSFSS